MFRCPLCPQCSPVHLICDMGICGDGASHMVVGCPLCVQSPPFVWCLPHTSVYPHAPLYVCMLYVRYGDTPHMLGSGGISMSVKHFGVCQYIHCSQSMGCFLQDWILGCLMPHAVVLFFIVFIMSQVSTTMAITTTPLVTMVSSRISSISSVTMAPSFDRTSCSIGSA